MEYVEFLRVRTALYWHIGIIVLIALFATIAGGAQVTVNGSTRFESGMTLPWSTLASIAAFFGAIFASSVGTSLSRENGTRELSWTKPLARTVLAVRFVAIDVCAIALAYAVALAAIAAVLTRMHVNLFFDETAPAQLLLGLGVGLMWYALLQVITCTLPPGARALSGVMWPVAFVIGALTQIPGATGALARVVNVINPLSYMSNTSSGSHMVIAPATPPEFRALMVWGFTIVFCAIAVAIWPRKEV